MAKLLYVTNVSLDGYIEDAQGRFEWGAPGDEVFTFITDLVRPVGTYLYGRRLYETMAPWETDPALAAESELGADFANIWLRADKVVYSTTRGDASTANTRLERRFDPDAVRALKTSAGSDLTVGGAALAAQACDAGLVDECHLLVYPVLVGGGKAAFASDARVQLRLQDDTGSATVSCTSATAPSPEPGSEAHRRLLPSPTAHPGRPRLDTIYDC